MRLFLFNHLRYSKYSIALLHSTYPTTVTAIKRKRLYPKPIIRLSII